MRALTLGEARALRYAHFKRQESHHFTALHLGRQDQTDYISLRLFETAMLKEVEAFRCASFFLCLPLW